MLARLPVKVISGSSVPSPTVNDRPAVPFKVIVPSVALMVTCKASLPASTSVIEMALPVPAEKTNKALSGMFCGPGTLLTGASLTPLMVMVKVCGADVSTPPLAVPPLSLSTIVIVAGPLALAAGVDVKVPVGLIAGPAENRPELVLPVTSKATVWPDSLAGPGEMAVAQLLTVCAPASSFTVWFGPLVNDGASLTELTVTRKVLTKVSTPPLAVPPLSFTVTVIVAEPLILATGVKLSEPVVFGFV